MYGVGHCQCSTEHSFTSRFETACQRGVGHHHATNTIHSARSVYSGRTKDSLVGFLCALRPAVFRVDMTLAHPSNKRGGSTRADKKSELYRFTLERKWQRRERSAPRSFKVRMPWGPRDSSPVPFMIMSILSILLAALLPVARAAPWQTLHARQSDRDNNSSNGLSPAIWVCAVCSLLMNVRR